VAEQLFSIDQRVKTTNYTWSYITDLETLLLTFDCCLTKNNKTKNTFIKAITRLQKILMILILTITLPIQINAYIFK
jgi:hypothetical protein